MANGQCWVFSQVLSPMISLENIDPYIFATTLSVCILKQHRPKPTNGLSNNSTGWQMVKFTFDNRHVGYSKLLDARTRIDEFDWVKLDTGHLILHWGIISDLGNNTHLSAKWRQNGLVYVNYGDIDSWLIKPLKDDLIIHKLYQNIAYLYAECYSKFLIETHT